MTIVGRSDISDIPHRYQPPSNPNEGRDPQGYGRRVPTSWMVRLPGSATWQRVYCCQISNASTCYVESKRGWHVIDGDTPPILKGTPS